MAMVFEDRVATYPNRYKVTPTNGDPEYYVVLERADDPTIAGTPLNSDTFNGILNEIESLLPDVNESDNGKVLAVTNGLWGKANLIPTPTLNSEKKLTEAGYYKIQAFVSGYEVKDFGIIYWDGATRTRCPSVVVAGGNGVEIHAVTIDQSGSIYMSGHGYILGDATMSGDATEWDIYTAKLVSPSSVDTSLPSAEGVSF